MTALPYEAPNARPELPFADQRGGMKAMGVILIVLGAFSGCLGVVSALAVPMMMMAQARVPRAAGQPAPPMPQTVDIATGVLVYVGFAAVLITVGVGSFKVRRWSRAGALVLTGSWALVGAMTMVSILVMAPGMRRMMANAAAAATPPGGAPPPAAAVATAQNAGMVMAIAFILLFGVLLPAGLFLFYRRASVRQTLDYFAHRRTWTDACPTPVLAASAWLALGSVMTVVLVAKGVVPVFGVLLTGPFAVAVLGGLAVLNAALAVGMFRLRPIAWWATLLATVIGLASVLLTFSRVDPFEMQRLYGTPPEQIEMMKQSWMNLRLMMLLSPILYGGLALGYLWWIGRYFSREGGQSGAEVPTALTGTTTMDGDARV